VRPSTIAIDGPAASGKSTIGYYLADYLGYLFLDTGVLYRAVTWVVQDRGIPVEAEAQITRLAEDVEIEVLPSAAADGRQNTVKVDGRDVTWEIRSPKVERDVSPVAAYPGVRHALTQRMREIARKGCVVMVGRDIGTVVIPDADLKLYVVASVGVRAQRRHMELRKKGQDVSYEQVLAGIHQRDRIDSSRATAPLRAAVDAVTVDTTDLSVETMFAQVERLVNHYDAVRSEQGVRNESSRV